MECTTNKPISAVNPVNLPTEQGVNGAAEHLPAGFPNVIEEIFSKLPNLEAARLVNKQWRELIVPRVDEKIVPCKNPNLQQKVMEQAELQKIAIGPRDWAVFCGATLPTDEDIQAAYACLPDNIHEILYSLCPVFPETGNLVKVTHVLVYISNLITPTSLGKLAETKLDKETPRRVEGYSHIWPKVLEKLDKPVGEAYWILMTKDVLGRENLGPTGSRNKRYDRQKTMVEDLAKRTGIAYTIPQTLEAVAAVIAHLLKSNAYIFGRGNNLCTYTRCKEDFDGDDNHVVVGGFASAGLNVFNRYVSDNVGVAVLWKFFLGSR